MGYLSKIVDSPLLSIQRFFFNFVSKKLHEYLGVTIGSARNCLMIENEIWIHTARDN
jgi:hypothetical protein